MPEPRDASEELRRSIAELKALLDAPIAPEAPAGGPPGPGERPPRRRRPSAVALLTAAALVLLVAVVTAWIVLGGDAGDDPDPGTTGTPGIPGTASPGPSPAASPPDTAAAAELPGNGPGADLPGTAVVARVLPDGAVEVLERARLAPDASGPVRLVLPDVARLGGQLAALSPAAQDVRVSVNGTPVAPRATGGSSWSVAVPGRGGELLVSYRLTGAVRDSEPSEAGRALALVAPLLGGPLRTAGLPLAVRAAGPEVRGVSCPDAPAALILCGEQADGGWTATVPDSAQPVVVLQLDRAG